MQLVWSGPVFGTNAYAKVAQNVLVQLHELGLDVKVEVDESTFIHLRNSLDIPNPVLLHMASKPMKHRRVRIHHTTPDKFKIDEKCKNIGIAYCETTQASEIWVKKCNQLDLLLLGSTHNEEVFQRSGVLVPTAVLPHGIDPQLYTSSGPVFDFCNDKIPAFKFLSVFEWTKRKGYDLLLRAFCEEFSHKDEVALLMKTIYRNSPSGEEMDVQGELRNLLNQNIQAGSLRPPVYIYGGILDDVSLSALYRACDAFVLPSRGEGVGLPYLEAGACGLPVVATAWGGQMDVLTSDNAFLCDYELEHIPETYSHLNRWHNSSMKWAEPKLCSLREQMRFVYEQACTRLERAKKLETLVRYEYTWNQTARKLAKYVKDVSSHHS